MRRLLGFETRMEVHGFLKAHGVFLNCSMENLENDIRESDRVLAILKIAEITAEQIAG